MAMETGIAWTDATVNFKIGCSPAGPGCDGCYASALAYQKWGIVFEPGGERRTTKSGFTSPLTWQRKLEAGAIETPHKDRGGDYRMVKTPVWVFACSLSDFFDKEWEPEVRARAWAMIRMCNRLRWQIVTKRVGLVERYLPDDWDGGANYRHVGIVSTQVNQEEVDRDMPKLAHLKTLGVHWIGVSIEPQLGLIKLGKWLAPLDWVISGGESDQYSIFRDDAGKLVKKFHRARPYHLEWAESLRDECRDWDTPFFEKQLGDNTYVLGGPTGKYGRKNGGSDISLWPAHLRVQQMPRIYDPVPEAA